MALPIDADELTVAWRALAGRREGDGWQTIPIASGNPCRILAGRHFPGNEEAILLGFQQVAMPAEGHLPVGRGFQVRRATVAVTADDLVWFSLMRQSAGNLDMFAKMASDIIGALGVHADLNQEGLLQLFFKRVRAWQSFMQRATDGLLAPEAEIGLMGELLVLQRLLGTTLMAVDVVDAWKGPLDELHDFRLGQGAIEVKATIAKGRFPATIGSLEQLDESLRNPMFLAAVRFGLDAKGETLPDFVQGIREALKDEPDALALFEIRLLHAGYLETLSSGYTRRFLPVEERVMTVQEDFPRQSRGMVNRAILDARYQIDLDQVSTATDVEVDHALQTLGVI